MKMLKVGILICFLGTVFGTGCNANLDTKKLVPAKTLQPTQFNPIPSASASPSGTPSTSPSGLASPNPSPSPTGSPVCPASTVSFSQISGGLLVQWIGEDPTPEISSTSLTSTAIVESRLNQNEGLYLSVVTDSGSNAAIGLIHCDSEDPNSPKIMDFAWKTANAVGLAGGNDPSVSENSSATINCPDATSNALIVSANQSLPSGATLSQSEAVRVRSTATESLYFATALGSNQQLFAILLHCDEKTPNKLDVLGVASSSSKGAE